jgi:hypothetical protein
MEVEVKPLFLSTEQNEPAPTPAPQPTPQPDSSDKPSFWDTIYKYRYIIMYTITFTVLICCAIYYFWKKDEPLKPATMVAQRAPPPAPQPTQQLAPQGVPPVIPPVPQGVPQMAQVRVSFSLDDIINTAETNISDLSEATIDEVSDEEPQVVEIPQISNTEDNASANSGDEKNILLEGLIDDTHVGSDTNSNTNGVAENDTCKTIFKNGRKCGKKTNGKQFCTLHNK